MDIIAGEEATSDHHSAGGCKVDASLAIVIGNGVQADWSNHRSKHFLSSNLSIVSQITIFTSRREQPSYTCSSFA